MPSPDSWGGPAACEPPFVEALRSLGHDVTTEIYVYGDKEKPTPFFSRTTRVLRTAMRFRRIVRENEYDVIHLNSSFDGRTILRDSFSLFLIGRTRAKMFVKLHGSMAGESAAAGYLTRKLIDMIRNRVDGFGYLSEAEVEDFVKLGFDRGRFYRVKNVVEVAAGNAAIETKMSEDVFELLFVSRFASAKGLVETIEACELVRKRGYRFRLTCVGDGESRREADDAVGRLGLGRVVTFTGYIPESEVAEQYAGSDIFVFPTSHPEGFPLVLFKAVAVGMPIVTTRIRAAADYLNEPDNCLFAEKTPERIAHRIVELIESADLRNRMRKNNLDLGKSFSAEAIAKEYAAIYERL